MNTSDKGAEFITQHEGERLKAYRDVAGILTIGVGHTGDVEEGDTITKEQSRELLLGDLSEAEDAVNAYVKVELNQNQYDALVSFVFNVGAGNFKSSTLLKKLNAGDYEGAAGQFERWDMAGGRHIPGLLKRRHAEAALFQSEYA
jgi:lysozyme